MMRRPGLKKMSTNTGPNMTPMVDIVMCILIFFMLSMEITGADRFLTSNLAAEKGNGTTEKVDLTVPPITFRIEILEDAATHRVTVRAFNQVFTDVEGRLPEVLEEKKRSMSGDVQILIQPRKNIPYQAVISVYDACIKAEFKNVAFMMPVE